MFVEGFYQNLGSPTFEERQSQALNKTVYKFLDTEAQEPDMQSQNLILR